MKLALWVPVLLLLSACAQEASETEQIRAQIIAMERFAEQGERGQFMRQVSDDFSGQNAQLDRSALNMLLLAQLNVNQRVFAQTGPVRIQMESASPARNATAEFDALLTGGRGWLPEQGNLFRFTTRWRKDEDEWILVAADWQTVTL